MINFKQILKVISNSYIGYGAAFFLGCILGNYLTARHHPVILALSVFAVWMLSFLWKDIKDAYTRLRG